uniref:SH3 domain-containing protein n=1 Tax=Megaselia scalaris TaxID=36166 RepID=T1GF93_MEGSC
MYAKALYDNLADTPEELTFKKGEILNVIEQDTEGLTGWWLCSLRGRQGICPGNRLRIMNSYDSGCFSLSPSSSPCQSLAASTATLNSSILSSDIYENTSVIGSSQQHLNQQGNNATSTPLTTNVYSRSSLQSSSYGQGNRRSWHVSPHKNFIDVLRNYIMEIEGRNICFVKKTSEADTRSMRDYC